MLAFNDSFLFSGSGWAFLVAVVFDAADNIGICYWLRVDEFDAVEGDGNRFGWTGWRLVWL
jgi:hypothetical protein